VRESNRGDHAVPQDQKKAAPRKEWPAQGEQFVRPERDPKSDDNVTFLIRLCIDRRESEGAKSLQSTQHTGEHYENYKRVLDNTRTDYECAGRTVSSLADRAPFRKSQRGERGASDQ
jgi:hypothetical protein